MIANQFRLLFERVNARDNISRELGRFDSTMSPEERLNRLERVVKMMISSGQRARGNLGFRIDALIDAQIRSEYLFNDRFAKLSDAQDRTDKQIKLRAAQKETDIVIKALASSQKETDERLRALIDIVGNSNR